MIEKLPFTEIHTGGEDMVYRVESRPVTPYEMQHKINELVDAVNSLRDDCNLLMGYIAPENKCEPAENTIMAKNANVAENPTVSKMEPAENGKCAKNAQDPYAEQRKWVGCLCRFWDLDGCISNYISLLKQIDDDDTPFVDNKGVCWEYCEPVKPDDDVIYKGGNNE